MKSLFLTILVGVTFILGGNHAARLPKRSQSDSSYLDQIGLSSRNKDVFDLGMTVLDHNFGLPFLCVSHYTPLFTYFTPSIVL